MRKETCNLNDYNHMTIFIFALPMIKAYLLNCYEFLTVIPFYLFFGFAYHYSFYKIKNITLYVHLCRVCDITVTHVLTPFLIYNSYFNNTYIFISMLFVVGIFLNYYVLPLFNIKIPHLINHFYGAISLCYCLDSCYEFKNICDLC